MEDETAPAETPRFTRIAIRSWKSIRECDLTLGPLTFIVGRNGAGKSNLVDALRFLADSMEHGLAYALRERGGIESVRRRGSGHPPAISFEVEWRGWPGSFVWKARIASKQFGGYAVVDESLEVREPGATPGGGGAPLVLAFRTRGKHTTWNCDDWMPSAPSPDDWLLRRCSDHYAIGGFCGVLATIGCYNLAPALMRVPQPADPRTGLAWDGRNIASCVRRLSNGHPSSPMARVVRSLRTVVPGVERISAKSLGPHEAVAFRMREGDGPAREFFAANVSDGTLRALGILVALNQEAGSDGSPPSLVAIEEPENALHPGALHAILECLVEASATRQVLVTSHSTDLLDSPLIPDTAILVAEMRDGETRIGPVDAATRNALRDGLFSPGELLRLDQIQLEGTDEA